MMTVDIGARAKKILHAVVSEYLATGEAVGSQTVTRRYGLDVSAATVRNVMGDLEEVGLLRHTHTWNGSIKHEQSAYADLAERTATDHLDDLKVGHVGALASVLGLLQLIESRVWDGEQGAKA